MSDDLGLGISNSRAWTCNRIVQVSTKPHPLFLTSDPVGTYGSYVHCSRAVCADSEFLLAWWSSELDLTVKELKQ